MANPAVELMSCRRAMVDIANDNRSNDTHSDEDHREKEILFDGFFCLNENMKTIIMLDRFPLR